MLIIIIPAIISQVFAVYLFYERHWYNVSKRMSLLLVSEIESLIKNVDYRQHQGEVQNYLNLSYIFLQNQKVTAKNENIYQEIEILKSLLCSRIKYNKIIRIDNKDTIEILFQIDKDILKVILPIKSLFSSSTYIFVLWIIFLSIILLIISIIFSKNQIRSILELTEAADIYGKGGDINRFKPSGAQEIRRAGLAFLKMKERIARQTAKRTQMLAMISHDLKTPLTRIRLQTELIEDFNDKKELLHDIESMQHIVNSYLDFAKGEGGENFIKVDINHWIKQFISLKWKSYNIKLVLENDVCCVQIKPHSLSRAIGNIIENAIKYANKILISTKIIDNEVMICLEDNGSGVDDEERKKLFMPFYRGDKARSMGDSSSVGLGLAITREIINGHYGTINVSGSKKLGGLLMTIVLPLINTNLG